MRQKNIINSTLNACLCPVFSLSLETNRPVRRWSGLRNSAGKDAVVPHTYINQVRQVVDVVFENRGIWCFQSQQVLVARFDRLQLVLGVLGLTLMKRIRGRNKKQTITEWTRGDEFNEVRNAFLTSYCAFMSLHTHSASPGRDQITGKTTTIINTKEEIRYMLLKITQKGTRRKKN